MYCLETSIVIDIFRGDEELKNKIMDLGSGNIFITTITLCELFKGAYIYHSPEDKIKDVDNFVDSFKVVGLDKKSCKEFGKIYLKLKKEGKLINDFDIIIAAITKINNLTLITRDKHFENIDVKVRFW